MEPKYECPVCKASNQKGEVIPIPVGLWGFRWTCTNCGRDYGYNISKPNFLVDYKYLTSKEAKERAKELEKAFLETILNKIMTVKKDEIEEDRREYPDEDEYTRLSYTLENFFEAQDYREIFEQVPEIWLWLREKLKDKLEDIATSKETFLNEVGSFDLDEFASEKLGDLQYDLQKILKAKYKKEE